MVNLILATLFSASFGLVVRHAQGRRCNLWAVGATNYVVAALYNLVLQATRGDLAPAWPTLAIGMGTGVSYVLAYFVLFQLMAIKGVSITTAATRLAVLVPVTVSVLAWGESPTQAQALGMLLALVSLPLLSSGRIQGMPALHRRSVSLLVALFGLNGLNLLGLRGYEQTGVDGEAALFLAFLFGTAAVIAVVLWFRHREGTSLADLGPGVALGLVNAFANLSMVAALRELPGFLVFPFHSAMGLVVTAVAARLIWNERITRLETAGLAVALLAGASLNLG